MSKISYKDVKSILNESDIVLAMAQNTKTGIAKKMIYRPVQNGYFVQTHSNNFGDASYGFECAHEAIKFYNNIEL